MRVSKIILIILSCASLVMGQWYTPKLLNARAEYRSALIGGEALSGVSLQFARVVDASASLWTYQSTEGWQSWNWSIRTDIRPKPCFPGKLILTIGINADMVNLTQRNPSPSLAGLQSMSRYRPTFAFGGGVDSVKIICRQCDYYFSGELLMGDFVPFSYMFEDASTAGESLSTTFVLATETATPFGAISVYRKALLRGWAGDNTWRIAYISPFCCGGLLRGTVGWESGFLGFANAEINVKPFAEKYPLIILLGMRLPYDTSLWQWQTGIQFQPNWGTAGDCGKGITTKRDVKILAAKFPDEY